jgi:hypothetical protein
MKKLIALVFAAGAFVLAGCCTTQQVAKWEYKQLSNGMVTDETLNRLGDEGWNVVGYNSAPGAANGFYLLKRPKQ